MDYDYMAYIGHDVQERPFNIIHLLFTVSRQAITHNDVIKWKHFRVSGPLWGESTGQR